MLPVIDSATGDNLFTDIDDDSDDDDDDDDEKEVSNSAYEMVVDHSSSFITADMVSKHSSFHSADGVHSVRAVTVVRTADEFSTTDRLNAPSSSCFAIDQK